MIGRGFGLAVATADARKLLLIGAAILVIGITIGALA